MFTAEDPPDPVGEFIGAKSSPSGSTTLRLPWIHIGSIGLSHGGLFVGSRQGTMRTPASLPPSLSALLWEVGGDPVLHFMALVPGGIVPDEKQRLVLAHLLESLAAPVEEPGGGDGGDRSSIDEPQKHSLVGLSVRLGGAHQHPIGAQRFGVCIVVLGQRLLDEAHRLAGLTEGMKRGLGESLLHQHSSQKPRAHSGLVAARRISLSRAPFFCHIRGRES